MGFYDEIPLFVDTNLGTHFALSVSQDITARDLKGKLGMEHFSCFPNLGKINVHGLTVRKKSFFYHLPDSMAIKHVFKELSGTWLLHLDASLLQNAPGDKSPVPFTLKRLTLSNSSPHRKNRSQKSASLDEADPFEAIKWTKNREVNSTFSPRINTENQPKHDCGKAIYNGINGVSEHSIEGKEHESLSILEKSGICETISVTGIISRFFSELEEVDSCYCQPKHTHETVQVHTDELRDSKIRTSASQQDHKSNRKSDRVASKIKKKQLGSSEQVDDNSSHISSRDKSCKYQVGKRLIHAANSIQISGNGKRSATKLLSKFRKLTSSDSALFVRRNAIDVDDFAD